jgi:hypothetical protein
VRDDTTTGISAGGRCESGRYGLINAWNIFWEPFGEFPLATREDRAAAAAALLTAVMQQKLQRVPVFAFHGPMAAGKSLLTACIAELAGGGSGWVPECRKEDELGSRRCILLDDIKGPVASSALPRLPTNTLVLISGNNFIPCDDLSQHIILARIDPKTENAHLRTFKRDAEQRVRSNRQEMVAAARTLLRGFARAGSPQATKDKLGSYEVWDGLIRQCVIWLGDEGIADLGDPRPRSAPER